MPSTKRVMDTARAALKKAQTSEHSTRGTNDNASTSTGSAAGVAQFKRQGAETAFLKAAKRHKASEASFARMKNRPSVTRAGTKFNQ